MYDWQNTELILITKKDNTIEFCSLEKDIELNVGSNREERFTTFIFHKMRYIWLKGQFVSVKELILSQKVKEFLKQFHYGNSKKDILARAETFGKNEIYVEDHSVMHILFHELSSSLGIFEITSFIIMSFEYG